jgi:hypothetical protein
MDDLLAIDGGGAARRWQIQHRKRKAREAAAKLRKQVREEAKADLRKRTKRWRIKLKAKRAANAAVGLPPPTKHGRPRDVRSAQFIDMTGRRFGRLLVIRVAPVSKQGCQRCRRWWVKCDCGSAERLVNGTNLRQGKVESCGCLVREKMKESWSTGRLAWRQEKRDRLKKAPLSIRIAELRTRILHRERIFRSDAKLLSAVRAILVDEEVKQGLRRRYSSGRPMLLQRAGLRTFETRAAA